MSPKVFVILPVYNRLDFTKKCLSGVKNQKYTNFETIVVDDGSFDGTFEYIRRYHSQVHIIQGDGNLWWSKATFLGIEFALAGATLNDYIFLLNNDCFIKSDLIGQMVKTAKKHPKSIIGSFCITTSKPVKVVEAGVRIDWPTGIVYSIAEAISSDPSYYSGMDIIDQIDALPGKGTLIPVSVFREVGSINYKKFPHYIADYEFFNRAKRSGYELLVDVKARVRHIWEATGYKSDHNETTLSFGKAWYLLFGRKSMNNILDWTNFLITVCPKKYLFRNLYSTFWRVASGLSMIFPEFPRVFCGRFRKVVFSPRYYLKLLALRLWLYVVQFPEYHLGRKK